MLFFWTKNVNLNKRNVGLNCILLDENFIVSDSKCHYFGLKMSD
jgi:hypothetical protein